MGAHRGVYGAAARGGAEAAAAGSSVLFRPVPAAGLPHAPSHYGSEGFGRSGSVGSDVEQSIFVHELVSTTRMIQHLAGAQAVAGISTYSAQYNMVDPRSLIYDPLFSGPPPERPENPMIHDPLFGKALLIDGLMRTALSPASAWARGSHRGSGEFCACYPYGRFWFPGWRSPEPPARCECLSLEGIVYRLYIVSV